jgi:hypothetical protein
MRVSFVCSQAVQVAISLRKIDYVDINLKHQVRMVYIMSFISKLIFIITTVRVLIFPKDLFLNSGHNSEPAQNFRLGIFRSQCSVNTKGLHNKR